MSVEKLKDALSLLSCPVQADLVAGNLKEAKRELLNAIQIIQDYIEEAEWLESLAKVWDEGYQAGINDERISEANIGVAGFDAKVNPARNNPYRHLKQHEKAKYSDIISDGGMDPRNQSDKPPPKREWVGLTDEQINLGQFNINPGDWNNLDYEKSWEEGFIAGAKFSQEKLKELNT